MIKTTELSCGIDQITGLDYFNIYDFISEHAADPASLYVACATDYQKEAKKALRKAGFKLVKRFVNKNSGNVNNLYIAHIRTIAKKNQKLWKELKKR